MTTEDKHGNTKESSNAEEHHLRRLIETYRPSLAVERFLGIFRFELAGNGLIPPSKVSKLISLLTSTFIVAIFVVFRAFPTAILGEPYEFDAFQESPSVIIFCEYWIACLLTTSINNESYIKIMIDISHIDTMMRLNITNDLYEKAHRETIVVFFTIVVVHIVLDFCDTFSDGVLTVSGITLIIVYFCQDLDLLAFYKLISMLQVRLEILNDYIKLVKERTRSYSMISNIEEEKKCKNNILINRVPIKLDDLASIYDKIGETCALINDIFNFRIFMVLVSALTYIIVTLWGTLTRIRSEETSTGNLTRVVIWSGEFICTVLILCLICEKLISTRNDTKILVNDVIMDYDQPFQVRNQAKAFMELVEAWPLTISVYDMFFVDVTLILKFISVTTTYLIVIIQISHFV